MHAKKKTAYLEFITNLWHCHHSPWQLGRRFSGWIVHWLPFPFIWPWRQVLHTHPSNFLYHATFQVSIVWHQLHLLEGKLIYSCTIGISSGLIVPDEPAFKSILAFDHLEIYKKVYSLRETSISKTSPTFKVVAYSPVWMKVPPQLQTSRETTFTYCNSCAYSARRPA